jgi:hypothetical protein
MIGDVADRHKSFAAQDGACILRRCRAEDTSTSGSSQCIPPAGNPFYRAASLLERRRYCILTTCKRRRIVGNPDCQYIGSTSRTRDAVSRRARNVMPTRAAGPMLNKPRQ